MVRVVIALGVLGSAIILPMRCATVSPTNTNAGRECRGSCSSSKPVSIDVEMPTLTTIAVAAGGQITNQLKCDRRTVDGGTMVGGELVCPASNTNSNTNSGACCRLTEVTIDPFIFTAEGTESCQGGGTNPGSRLYLSKKSCTSLKDGVKNELGSIASLINSDQCTGGSDCGYQVKGRGLIEILECPDKCEIVGGHVTWDKTCKAVDVEGFLDEYKVQATVSTSQKCQR